MNQAILSRNCSFLYKYNHIYNIMLQWFIDKNTEPWRMWKCSWGTSKVSIIYINFSTDYWVLTCIWWTVDNQLVQFQLTLNEVSSFRRHTATYIHFIMSVSGELNERRGEFVESEQEQWEEFGACQFRTGNLLTTRVKKSFCSGKY